MLFNKKTKQEIIKVIHYEGIKEYNQDYPCNIVVNEYSFEFKRVKPEMTITLPKDKIIKIDVLKENAFMQKYHNTISTNKLKYYLVITYKKDEQEHYIAFWGTAKEAIKFDNLKYKYIQNVNYTL